jgi:acyl-CoA-binding protein
MATEQEFLAAAADVKGLSYKPSNQDLLSLYALFKQATQGDVSGKKPGRFDLKGRAKYEAWSGLQGTSADQARDKYISLVRRLQKA